jgi:hypothetical protein
MRESVSREDARGAVVGQWGSTSWASGWAFGTGRRMGEREGTSSNGASVDDELASRGCFLYAARPADSERVTARRGELSRSAERGMHRAPIQGENETAPSYRLAEC